MARENREHAFAVDEFALAWRCEALDVDSRQELLARALAAGRPPGMSTWADEGEPTLDTSSKGRVADLHPYVSKA
jgi:hypothetical protein